MSTTATTVETPTAALARIRSGFSKNDIAVIHAFAACDVPADDITPRVNVLTFKAWKAKDRSVAKGAKGQKVTIWAPTRDRKTGETRIRPLTAVLFHESQTVPLDDAAAVPAGRDNTKLFR